MKIFWAKDLGVVGREEQDVVRTAFDSSCK